MTLLVNDEWSPESDSLDFRKCRTLLHSWDHVPHPSVLAPRALTLESPSALDVWFRCTRCHTHRRDTIDRTTGDVIARRYLYAEGYRHSYGDGEAPMRSEWRLAYLRGLHVLNGRGKK